MQSEHPREYVSLVSGDSENFSEVYGHRLENREPEVPNPWESLGVPFPPNTTLSGILGYTTRQSAPTTGAAETTASVGRTTLLQGFPASRKFE